MKNDLKDVVPKAEHRLNFMGRKTQNSQEKDIRGEKNRRASSFEETELKLVGKPSALSSLFESFPGKTQKSAKVISTYFDTRDDRLWNRGYTLRLRKKGSGYELTLKSRGGEALTRGEWTSLVNDAVPDLGLLPDAAPRREIGVILAEELVEKFTSEITRKKKLVQIENATIEACLDAGRIYDAACEETISELEFELKEGSATALVEAIKPKLARRRLSVRTRTKSDRGFDLAHGSGPAYFKASKPSLNREDTIASALAKILAVTTGQIIANMPAAEVGTDPEGVHQLRVGLRRLRSALSVFKSHLTADAIAIGPRAKLALSRLGPARDLDVFLLETLPPVCSANADVVGLKKLQAIAEARQRVAYREVRSLIYDGKFNQLLLDLLNNSQDCSDLISVGADERLEPTAIRLLNKRHRQVRKLGRNFAALEAEPRHDVRIALKKLRYACDYFQALFPAKNTQAYLRKLASLQDDLGHLNDVSVAEILIDDLCHDDTEAAVGGALAKGWYTHRLTAIEPHMIAAWMDFANAKPFWRN